MTHGSGRAAVILLVDDDPGDRELTQREFQRSKIRNELHMVVDGEEALDYLLRRGNYVDPATSPRPDLVLLDLNMPKKDGREVLAELQQHPEMKSIPIIVMTVSDQESDVLKSYDLGATGYVVKPVDIGQFSKVISTLQDYWLEVVVLPPTRSR
tara:strand:- start:6506 stop:6967 length:462 start_codon:yes stop_codon:yes gene_type:complete